MNLVNSAFKLNPVCQRELWQTAFYWTFWDQILSTIKKKTDTQRGVAGNRNNKIYIHPLGNEPFNCVSHPSSSQLTSHWSILHTLCRWVALQNSPVVKYTNIQVSQNTGWWHENRQNFNSYWILIQFLTLTSLIISSFHLKILWT